MLRFGRVGSGAVMALVLAGSCFGASGGNEKYFGKDTEVVVTLNVRQILNSELVKGNKEATDKVKALVQQMLEADPQAQKYIKSLGFDVFRHLDSVTMILPGSADPTKGLAILHGKFDRAKFSDTAEDAAKNHPDVLKLTKSGNFQVVEVTPPGEDKTIYISLVNSDTVLVSQGRDALTEALGRDSSSKKTELRKEIKDLLATRDARQSLSFAATSSALNKIAQAQAQQNPQAAMIGPLLQMLDGFNGGVNVTKDIQFLVGIGTKDAEAAKQLSMQAGAGIGAAGGMLAKKAKEDAKLAPWVDVVKSIRANSDGNRVIIRGQIPAAVLEQALKQQ